ncbi:MAG: GNAT family N-acetyltransferase [Burkholderiaceae bacterium]
MQSSEPSTTVSLDKIPPLEELAAQWRELESRARPSFFLTWSWIGNWLASLGEHVERGWVLSARQEGRLVGLAVIFDAPIRRRLLPLGRAAYLNETGLTAFDAQSIEYNGLLLDAHCAPAVQRAMLERLCADGSCWREVHLRNADASRPELAPANSAKAFRRGELHDCWLVDLHKVRERGGDFVGLLGSGRRAHIRRCLRAYAQLGPLQLTVAHDVPTALEFFDRMMVLHDSRFAEIGRQSNFSNSFGRLFHNRLVTDAHPRGEVQMLRIAAGGNELGYLYSFVHHGRICFYQSGFDYRLLDKRFSPGLVTLVLAIEHNAAQGMRWFDFLAGEQNYKSTLATDHSAMISWSLQRRSILAATETVLRWKVRLVRRSAAKLRVWIEGKKILSFAGAMFIGALSAFVPETVFAESCEPTIVLTTRARPI